MKVVQRLMAIAAFAGAIPGVAYAQYSAPSFSERSIGEKYHVELSGSFWTPTPFGVISSEQFGIPGTDISLVDDLGFLRTRFRDLKVVLRPAKKHRFRIQYTPLQYSSETTLKRAINFNGITFPCAGCPLMLPINAQFGWNVWRFGYEYDFLYKKRGFAGVILEARETEFSAGLQSPVANEFTSAKGPLPALGFIGRGYVMPDISITAEVTGLMFPKSLLPDIEANYFDWDIYGTFNVTNHAGLQVGWRRLTTFLNVEHDTADMKFQGMWWGGTIRF
jgi:hypothetical protein